MKISVYNFIGQLIKLLHRETENTGEHFVLLGKVLKTKKSHVTRYKYLPDQCCFAGENTENVIIKIGVFYGMPTL